MSKSRMSANDRHAIWRLHDGDPCHYCGGAADTLDHIVPAALGGNSHQGNVVPACRECNERKADDCWGDHCDMCADAWWYALRKRFGAAS